MKFSPPQYNTHNVRNVRVIFPLEGLMFHAASPSTAPKKVSTKR